MIRLVPTRISVLAIGVVLAALFYMPQANAFCFSNDSLSKSGYTAAYVSPSALKRLEHLIQCKQGRGWKCVEAGVWDYIKVGAASTFKDIIGKGYFRKDVGPDGTQCCSWKNKSCNPGGTRSSKNLFLVYRLKTPKHKIPVKIGGRETGIRVNAKIGDIEWARFMRISAADHVECRFDGYHYGCRNYQFGQSAPPHVNGKTRVGVQLRSTDTGKCLTAHKRNSKGTGWVSMKTCNQTGQRWTIFRNGVIRSQSNNDCLDVAVRTLKDAKNGSNVVTYKCHGKGNQRWNDANGLLISGASRSRYFCLEVGGWNKKDNAPVNIWRCGKKQTNQTWYKK